MHLTDIVKQFPHQTYRDENDIVLNVVVTNDVTKQDFYNDILHDFMTKQFELASYTKRGQSFSSFTVFSGKMAGITFVKHPCNHVEAYRALTINSLLPNNSRNVLAYVVGDDGKGYLVLAWSEQVRFIANTPEIAKYASRISTYVGIHLWPQNFVVDGLSPQYIDVGFQMSNPMRLFVDNYLIHTGKAFETKEILVSPMNRFRNMPANLYQLQNMIKFNSTHKLLDENLIDKILDEVACSLPRKPSSDHEQVYCGWLLEACCKLPKTRTGSAHIDRITKTISSYPEIDDEEYVYQNDFHDLIRQSRLLL